MRNSAFLATVVCCIVLLPLSAHGSESAQCITSLENGQVQRKNGHLQEARAEFTRCAERGCPSSLQLQCGKFLDEVNAAIPSVFVSVTIDGEDTIDVAVEMDGSPLTSGVGARGVEVEPGLHTFIVRVPGFASVERKVLIREGEQHKSITVSLSRPKPENKPQPVPPPPERPIPVGVWISGGIGLAGLVLGTAFEVAGETSRTRLEGSCAPRCTNSDINSIHTNYVVGDVALGVGAAGLVTAAVWYFLRPARLETSSPAAERPSISLIPGVRSLQLQATF